MVQSSYLKGNTTKPNTNEEQLNDIFCEAVSFDTSKNDCPISSNGFHFHNTYVILFVTFGEGVNLVNHDEYEIKENRIFFLNSDQTHTFHNVSCLKGIGVAFSDIFFTMIQTMLADHIKYEIFNRNGKCMFCDVDMQNVNSLTNVLKEMIKESTRISLYGHNSIMASLLTEFIMKAERYGKWSQEVRRNINSTSYKTFLDFIALVDANFKTKKEIKWYAGELGISTVLLARYTKMYDCNPQHPQTPLKILNNRIYIEAEHLLRHTNMTIEQISDTLGFNDYSYFIKSYKKINPQKRTPLQCRNSWNTSVCRSSL